jgi:hypothetical protein
MAVLLNCSSRSHTAARWRAQIAELLAASRVEADLFKLGDLDVGPHGSPARSESAP